MMKRKSLLLLTGSLLLLLGSCYYDQELEVVVPDIPDTQQISFAADIEPLFVGCTSCHDGSIANPDLRQGNAYAAIVPSLVQAGDAAGSTFYNRLPGNSHPIDAGFVLTTDEIALIKAWIDRGALDN